MERRDTSFTNAAAKLSHHQEAVTLLLENKPVVPITMEVDISLFCGDQCSFCHFAYTHEKPVRANAPLATLEKVFMTPSLANELFKKMASAGVKSIVFSGGGEPTDSPFAQEIFRLAKSHGLELGMYTRGFNLNGEIASFVAQSFEWVVVSLDATNADDHKEAKGTGERIFSTKIENIRNFLAIAGRRANISVSEMVDGRHLQKVASYPEQQEFFGKNTQVTKLERDIIWLLGLGVDEVQIRPIVDTGSYKEQRKTRQMKGLAFMGNKEVWQEHYSWVPGVMAILERYTGIPRLNPSIDKFRQVYEGVSGQDTCYGMMVSAGLVANDGKVYKCANTREIPRKIIGDLKTQSMEEIFLSPNLDRKVDEFCRVGCRGCKVNEAFHHLKESGGVSSSPRQGVKHVNFI